MWIIAIQFGYIGGYTKRFILSRLFESVSVWKRKRTQRQRMKVNEKQPFWTTRRSCFTKFIKYWNKNSWHNGDKQNVWPIFLKYAQTHKRLLPVRCGREESRETVSKHGQYATNTYPCVMLHIRMLCVFSAESSKLITMTLALALTRYDDIISYVRKHLRLAQ